MNRTRLITLSEKYLRNELTVEEMAEYEQLLRENDPELSTLRQIVQQDDHREETEAERQAIDRMLVDLEARIQSRLATTLPTKTIHTIRYRWVVAAAIVLAALATGLYFYQHRSAPSDIAPGYNQATLTLADGTKINLDSAQSGIIIADEYIKYNNGNNVLAEKGRGPGAPGTYNVERTTYNSLTTPKGGQYQIILEDGTKVWLNAASTLKYPSRFSGATRAVFLEGEGYFEIKDDKAHPFHVQTSRQTIQVVGTHFNVNSYQDEPLEKTTLIEGAVKVTSGTDTKLLQPGQEASIKNGVQVADADLKSAMAWQNGRFVFNDESLESIMRKVARWYNVEISYQGADKEKTYYGSFSRFDKVSSVLRKLELTGSVHFNIEGRRITATK